MKCVICHGPLRRLFQHQGCWILGCEACHHRTAEVAPCANHVGRIYDDKYFHGGGAGYSDYLSEAEILRTQGQKYGSLLARHMTPGTLLDVGAAAGFVLKGFLDQGWSGEGIEPNPAMAEYARTHLGLRVVTGTLEGFESEREYDVVSMIQVIAHFVDLQRALRVAAERTRQGGFWLIETWNRESWTARAFGKHWHEYSPPSVLHWFSPEGLRRLAAQFGFQEIARGRPSKWIGGEHAKSLLRYRLESSRLGKIAAGAVNLIPDRIAIPYPAEDLFWTLYQKS
jgi:SAM-dependent methyltransferase